MSDPRHPSEHEPTENRIDRINREQIREYTSTPTSSIPPQMEMRPRFVLRQTPPLVSRFMLVANVLAFVAMIIYGFVAAGWQGALTATEDLGVLILFGAKVNQLVATGQVWRLFTAMFLHIGVIHLLFNLYALFSLGPLVESYFGHLRFAAIYLIGGLFGSLASYAFSPAVSAGASGAIFSLAGCLLIYFYRYRENFGARGRAILYNMLVVVGINLVFGLSQPGIDNWGHMGGLAGGILVTLGLLPRYRRPAVITYGANVMEEEPRELLSVGWILVCLAIWYYGLQWATDRILSQF